MDRLPDAEIESDLQASLIIVVGGGHLDVDGDPLRMSLGSADCDEAVSTPKVAEELLDQAWIAEPDDHPSHCLARIPTRQVGTCGSGRLDRLGSWRF
jgi:hypothetical protein